MASSDLFADLPRLVREAPPESLPALLGRLEQAKAEIWARLTALPPPGQANPPEENLGAREAARRLGVSESWLYKNSRHLPFVARIGRRVVFSARRLERWNLRRLGGS